MLLRYAGLLEGVKPDSVTKSNDQQSSSGTTIRRALLLTDPQLSTSSIDVLRLRFVSRHPSEILWLGFVSVREVRTDNARMSFGHRRSEERDFTLLQDC